MKMRIQEKYTLSPIVVGFLIIAHALTVVALFNFSGAGLALFLVGWFLTACMGITFGFHRLLSHRSFKAHPVVEVFSSMCGILALQGPPMTWVAHHRMHHAGSDTDKDPHNSRLGFWFSHIVWLSINRAEFDDESLLKKYARDIDRDPYYNFISQLWFMITVQVLWGLMCYALAGWSGVLWGVFARLCFVYHVTWFVNSATHYFGYVTYESGDLSKNNWWVALLSFGEGWHNNHHTFEKVCPAGHAWYEIDVTYYVVWTLEKLGLVWDVQKLPADRALRVIPVALPVAESKAV